MKNFTLAILVIACASLPQKAEALCAPSPSTAHVIEILECYSHKFPHVGPDSKASSEYISHIGEITNRSNYYVIGGRRIEEATMHDGVIGEWQPPSSDDMLFLYVNNPAKGNNCSLMMGRTTEVEQAPKCCDTSPIQKCLNRMHFGRPIRDENGCWKGITGMHCRKRRDRP